MGRGAEEGPASSAPLKDSGSYASVVVDVEGDDCNNERRLRERLEDVDVIIIRLLRMLEAQ